MAELNTDGNIEVYSGPRGFSVVGAEGDGTNVRFVTNEPRTLNPVALPRGAKGDKGVKGDPGQASIRVDETAGYRVFLWEIAVPSEQMVYGDTGVRAVTGGTVRRTGNTVETTVTDTTTLPPGFRPTIDGNRPMFFTADPWPTTLPGTKVTDPTRLKGLEGYDAATANGYPGTPDQWLEDRYRVLQDPAGASLGQVYTRTVEGAGWRDLPQIGPGPWRSLTLDPGKWKVTSHLGNLAQARLSDGRVSFYGHITYTGPKAEAGLWAYEGVRIGVLPPDMAPTFNFELSCVTYDGVTTWPVPARLHVSDKGVMQLLAFSFGAKPGPTPPAGLPVRAGVTQIGLTGLSYDVRSQ